MLCNIYESKLLMARRLHSRPVIIFVYWIIRFQMSKPYPSLNPSLNSNKFQVDIKSVLSTDYADIHPNDMGKSHDKTFTVNAMCTGVISIKRISTPQN